MRSISISCPFLHSTHLLTDWLNVSPRMLRHWNPTVSKGHVPLWYVRLCRCWFEILCSSVVYANHTECSTNIARSFVIDLSWTTDRACTSLEFYCCLEQGFGSGLLLTGSGSNLSRQTGSGSMIFSRPDPDPETSVLEIFHLFYDDF